MHRDSGSFVVLLVCSFYVIASFYGLWRERLYSET
jgi:hypothetical protein